MTSFTNTTGSAQRINEAKGEIANYGPITMNQFKVSNTRITACIMAHIFDSRSHLVSFSVSQLSF
jgi:hypothetical protein